MFARSFGSTVVLTAVALMPVLALAGIGGDESTAEIATGGPLSLFCLPDGSGHSLTEAYIKSYTGGNPVSADATITLTVRDYNGVVIPFYPAEDLWLQWIDDSALFVCAAGTIADSDTDIDGVTTWVAALRLGGYSEALVQVRINGDALTDSAGFALSANSPDINADGNVDLIDVGHFARDFPNSTYSYRSDFACDGVLNVADVGKMVRGVGASCP